MQVPSATSRWSVGSDGLVFAKVRKRDRGEEREPEPDYSLQFAASVPLKFLKVKFEIFVLV